MRRVLLTALATAGICVATATPAGAVVLQQCNGANCVSGTTNVNLGTFNDPGAAVVTGTVGIGGPVVQFTSTQGNLETNTGAATVFLAADNTLLTNLTFALLTGGFTAAEFNLENGDPKSFSVRLTTSTGLFKDLVVANANGSNVFNIIAEGNEVFTGATIQTTNGGFADLKQLRLVLSPGSVPEPATWAMMLLGFGGIGMAMRRSRRRNGALMQIA